MKTISKSPVMPAGSFGKVLRHVVVFWGDFKMEEEDGGGTIGENQSRITPNI